MQLLTSHQPVPCLSLSSSTPQPAPPSSDGIMLSNKAWDIPLASCPGCVLSQLLGHPSPLTGRAARGAETSWALCDTALQQLTHLCVIRVILIPNPKCCTIAMTRKKINSIPDKNQDSTSSRITLHKTLVSSKKLRCS